MATEPRFDHWIREAMQAHEVPFQPDHWNIFEVQLAAEADASGDDALREKLDNMEAPLQVASWAAFADLLDDAMPVADPFDSLIRTQLTAREVPAAAATTWAAMSAALDDAMPTAEANFDKTVRDRMTRFEAPYNATHWAKMAEKLDRQRRWYNLLLQYKVAEVALMLMLLFTVVNLAVITPALKERNAERVRYYSPAPNAPAKRVSPYMPAATMPSSPANFIKTIPTTPKSEPTTQPMASATLPMAGTPVSAVGMLPLLHAENSVPSNNQAPIQNNVAYAPSITPVADYSTESQSVTTLIEALQKSIKLLDIRTDDAEPSAIFAEVAHNIKVTEMPKFTLGLVVSTDADYIGTPYDAVRRRKPYTVRGSGFTVGAMFNYNQRNSGIETGLTYGEKSYSTPLTFKFGNFHDGYFEEKVEEIRYKIVSIPVNLRYIAARRGAHKFYILGGATLNAVADAAYTRTLALLTNSREPAPLPAYIPPSPSADMHFPEGFAAGGSLSENIFVTANVGVGYEYSPKPGLSFYAQPTYHRNISEQGVGPKHDKISSVSLLVGTRVSL